MPSKAPKKAEKEKPAKAAKAEKVDKKSAQKSAKAEEIEVKASEETAISEEDQEDEDEAASSGGGGGNAAALAAATGTGEMSASFKNFRHHPDMENFYRFIYENDLRHEALEILDELLLDKQNKRVGSVKPHSKGT